MKRSIFHVIAGMVTVGALLFGSATLSAAATPAARPITVTMGDAGVPAKVLAAARNLVNASSSATTTMRAGAGTSLAADLPPIDCFGRSQYPHPSTGLPGSLDGKADSWCTAPVTQIQAQATLYEYLDGYGFVLAGRSPLRYLPDTAGTITAVAFAVCVGSPRYFVGTGYHFFVAPPYYSPATARLDSATPLITVSC